MLVCVALPLRPGFSDQIAAFHFQLPGKNIGIRLVADGNEDAENVYILHCTGLQILDAQAGNTGIVAQNFIKRTVVENGDLAGLLFLEQLVLHDFFGAELLAAMNQGDVAGDVGQIQRFFDGCIAAANDGDRFVAVKETIASGAGGNALAGKFFFRGQAEILGRGAGGNNQRIAGIGAGVADQREWAFRSAL
jgi:hypothetical protein